MIRGDLSTGYVPPVISAVLELLYNNREFSSDPYFPTLLVIECLQNREKWESRPTCWCTVFINIIGHSLKVLGDVAC